MASGHRHRWRFAHWSTGGTDVLTLTFNCRCGETCARPATAEERQVWDVVDKQGEDAHAAWTAFTDEFKDFMGQWEYRGYDFMERARRWAEDHPQDVRYVGVDDAHHSNAGLVFVEHRSTTPGQEFYMGTSVVFIPQTTGEDPIVFFLYPGDRQALRAALSAIATAARPIERLQRENERRFDALGRSAKP